MVRGYERYYQKASRSTRDPRLDGAWSPSLDMDALGLRAKWWRGPYEGPDGNNPSAPLRGADAPWQPPQEAIKLGNTTYADRVAAWAYSYDCALFEQAMSVIFRNDTGLDFPGVGRTCNHHHLLAHMGKECKAGRCPKMKVAGAPVDSMLVALGIPSWAPEWAANEDDDNFEALYAMHFLTAVVSGIGCLLFFRLYSDAIKQARRPFVSSARRRLPVVASTASRRLRRHAVEARVTTHTKTQAARVLRRRALPLVRRGRRRLLLLPARRQLRRLRGLRRHALQAPQHLGRQPRRLHGSGFLRARRRGGGRELRVRKRDEPRVRRGRRESAPAAVGEKGGRDPGAYGLAGRFQYSAVLPVVDVGYSKRTKRDNEGDPG